MTDDDNESDVPNNKPKLQLPNLDEFEESYQHTIKRTKNFYGDLTKSSKKASHSKK